MTEQATLFFSADDSHKPGQAAVHPGPFAGVALEQGIDRVLDYAIEPRLVDALRVGQRVRVPLGRGNTATFGMVVRITPTSDYPKTKPILSIADERVLVTPALMDLSRWMSRYYAAPLGIVLETIIPSAVKKRVGLGYSRIVHLKMDREEVQTLLEKTSARKRRSILARLLLLEPGQGIEIVKLASEAGCKPPAIRKLQTAGVVTIRSEADLSTLTPAAAIAADLEKPLTPNEDQQKVLTDLQPRVAAGGFSVNLLHGITGSGKTEIYLRCIADVISRGKKALVLVPEIALTPQTVSRFVRRFPRVAVLHSGLSSTQRHRYWQQIRQGGADIVVGARSAVFAPLSDLGIIIVDEEHDSSYKQDQIPRFHGRDVAIKRAQLESVPIILGSATPSLEMYWRCAKNKPAIPAAVASPGANEPSGLVTGVTDVASRYHYLQLPRRARGALLPPVELVDMKQDRRMRRGVHLISVRLEHLLKTTFEAGHQAILLLNRRGYANFVCCPSCGEVINCKFCDATMTYHRSAETHAKGATSEEGRHTGQLHCHYCLAVNTLPEKCPACSHKLSLFGLGTQRVEEELMRKLPEVKFLRVDSDTMHGSKDYEAALGKFARREIQLLIGTQMIAKGLDYPNVTLVGVVSADTALALPDFRASERTFQLLTQVAGRAGRGEAAGRVVFQTFLPDDATIRFAMKQDYTAFAASELRNRAEVRDVLPPYSRMARIILRHEDQEKLLTLSQQIAEKLTIAIAEKGAGAVILRGPMPCPIGRIAGYYRHQIVLSSRSAEPLQASLAAAREAGAFAKAEAVAVDVDPVSLL